MKKMLKKYEILALLNFYKELKHSLCKFYKGNASIPYINSKVPRFRIFRQVFRIFGIFSSRKKTPTIFWTPMSMQNFPRIPKITLKKSCDQSRDIMKTFAKKPKNPAKSMFFFAKMQKICETFWNRTFLILNIFSKLLKIWKN